MNETQRSFVDESIHPDRSVLPEKTEHVEPEIEQLEEPIKDILLQIREKIESGYYDLLIGDDPSGRIPTLILKKFFDAVYKEKNSKPIIVRFLAGTINNDSIAAEKIANINSVIQNKGHHNALVITEFINTGKSSRILDQALQQSGLHIDYAAIATSGRKEEIEQNIKHKIYSSTSLNTAPNIYNKNDFTGLLKYDKNKTHADTLVHPNVQRKMKARQDAAIIAQRIINWYKNQNENHAQNNPQ